MFTFAEVLVNDGDICNVNSGSIMTPEDGLYSFKIACVISTRCSALSSCPRRSKEDGYPDVRDPSSYTLLVELSTTDVVQIEVLPFLLSSISCTDGDENIAIKTSFSRHVIR